MLLLPWDDIFADQLATDIIVEQRHTRAYNSTLYILYSFHRVASNSMEGGGWYDFAAPLPDAHPRLAGTLLLRPLQQGFRKIVVWRCCGGHDLRETVKRFNETYDGQSTAFLPGHPYHDVWCRTSDPSIPGGHADSFITSITLHLRPEAVRKVDSLVKTRFEEVPAIQHI